MKKARLFILFGLVLQSGFSSFALCAQQVGAKGYIAPAGGIIELSGPAGDVIEDIRVKKDDSVEKGTSLILFRSHREKEGHVALCKEQLKEADKLGLRAIDIQRLKIKAAEENHRFASDNYNRFRVVDGKGISAKQMAAYEHEYNQSSVHLETANQELGRLVMKRDIDMARASENLALAEMKPSTLEAPIKGIIIDILAHPGETVTGVPVIRMADLDRMVVIADVFESDVLKLKPGMKAAITHRSLPNGLSGVIESIERIVSKKSKIINVRILLYDAGVASRLIHMEVDVTFDADGNGQEK